MDTSGLHSVEHDWSDLACMHAMDQIETLDMVHLYTWVYVYLMQSYMFN